MTDKEKLYIQLARSLGARLRLYAKERREEDKKMIHSLHHQIAQLHRREELEMKEAADAS